MASIVKRNNRYCVVYTYKHTNGTLKQKWETFTDLADAKNRKKEVEYKESVGTFVAPQCRTLKDLLKEYVTLYGRTKWALSTYHTSYGCMVWFTNAKQANIRRETYTSQLMKGGHFTMNLPLFISSANFLLMKSLLLVLFQGLCSLLGLTAQQKIH